MFRRAISKLLLPNLERDLSSAINVELAAAHQMTDCMIAPTVHGFQTVAAPSAAFAQTAARHQRTVKVEYAALPKGLFQ
jgi:hypothetical protein